HTGYLFGGTSPFGTLKPLPVYYEKTILELPIMLINCGKRGFLVEMAPADVVRILDAKPVDVGIAD
ncbi:MAG: Cys-tRNA(Pro) deacylase, partial [Myxococcales bacterium]|nr:Cys-tRNA(Pro) deacylase [Myxococcales bacterium]